MKRLLPSFAWGKSWEAVKKELVDAAVTLPIDTLPPDYIKNFLLPFLVGGTTRAEFKAVQADISALLRAKPSWSELVAGLAQEKFMNDAGLVKDELIISLTAARLVDGFPRVELLLAICPRICPIGCPSQPVFDHRLTPPTTDPKYRDSSIFVCSSEETVFKFKCRGEYAADIKAFVQSAGITEYRLIPCWLKNSDGKCIFLPEWWFEFNSGLKLDALLQLLRRQADAHIMMRTLEEGVWGSLSTQEHMTYDLSREILY